MCGSISFSLLFFLCYAVVGTVVSSSVFDQWVNIILCWGQCQHVHVAMDSKYIFKLDITSRKAIPLSISCLSTMFYLIIGSKLKERNGGCLLSFLNCNRRNRGYKKRIIIFKWKRPQKFSRSTLSIYQKRTWVLESLAYLRSQLQLNVQRAFSSLIMERW